MLQGQKWIPASYIGKSPPETFGHTATQVSKTRLIIFGGAVKSNDAYTMTNDCYLFNIFKNEWSKLTRIFAEFS